jgi:tetratricopeptide (TPR) repeat protein
MAVAEPVAPVTPAGPLAPTHKLKIGAVKVGPLEVGPFEIDWPLRLGRGAVRIALGGVVLASLVCAVVYLFILRPGLGEARDAMRLGDYRGAVERLEVMPKWVAGWPERRALLDQARFGARLRRGEPITDLPLDFEKLVSRYPGAPDVLVFQGLRHFYADHDFAKAIAAFTSATSADPRHAEAHFLAAGLRQELASQSLARGDEASARNEYAQALDLMDRAIEQSPVAAHVKRYASQRASLLDSLGDAPRAYRAYARLAAGDAMSAVQAAMTSWRLPDSIAEVRDGKDAAQAQSAKLEANPKEAVEGWMFGIPARGSLIVGTPNDQRCLADWAVSISDAIIESHASRRRAVASPGAKSPGAGASGTVAPGNPAEPKSCSDANAPNAVRVVVCIKILAAQQALPPTHPRIQELEAWKQAAPACDPDLKPPAVLPPLEGQRVA